MKAVKSQYIVRAMFSNGHFLEQHDVEVSMTILTVFYLKHLVYQQVRIKTISCLCIDTCF